jgi:hypothetical protein
VRRAIARTRFIISQRDAMRAGFIVRHEQVSAMLSSRDFPPDGFNIHCSRQPHARECWCAGLRLFYLRRDGDILPLGSRQIGHCSHQNASRLRPRLTALFPRSRLILNIQVPPIHIRTSPQPQHTESGLLHAPSVGLLIINLALSALAPMLANRPKERPILEKQCFAHEQLLSLRESQPAFPPGPWPLAAPMLHRSDPSEV